MLHTNCIGHLGSDAECKSSNGREFTTFRVAHSNRWTDDAGQVHEETIWVDCIIQGKPNVLPYLKKGQQVYVSGSVSLRVYSSAKDRCMKAGLTINVRQVELLGGKSDEVPSVLFNPADNTEHKIGKYFHCADFQNQANPTQKVRLVSKSNEQFYADSDGWIHKYEEQSV